MKKRKGAIKATIRSWVDVKFGLQRIGGCFTFICYNSQWNKTNPYAYYILSS